MRVELPREESRRRLEDLIRAAQLTVLALELLDPLGLRARHPSALPAIGLGPAHPTAQRLGRHPEILSERRDSRPQRRILALLFKEHPRRPLTDLTRIRRLPRHMAPILSRDRASKFRGAIQLAQITRVATSSTQRRSIRRDERSPTA